MGIEPTSSAWEAEVIAIIRRPLTAQCPQILQSDGVTSHGLVVEEWYKIESAGRNTPVPEIGSLLDVGHVLEGSVRQQGKRVRITAQLIDVDLDR